MTELVFGHQAIRAYKRLSYTPWHAIAEFVDNSTQAYFNNRTDLDAVLGGRGVPLTVSITYDRSGDLLLIEDNSMGMTREVLDAAMVVGMPPPDPSGRSRYGMGLKTAACWLGDLWSVRTSALGDGTEYTVTVDVDEVAKGTTALPMTEKPVGPDEHYTVIEVRRLNRQFYGRTLGKIREHLASMYREDLRLGILDLRWMGESLRWVEPLDRFLTDPAGRPYREILDIRVDDKTVGGWAGVLAKGSRSQAGFSILHSGRVVRGWPESWRPQEIFGQTEGSNDLVNQRLVGEITLDDFDVTHTKDDILWVEGEQDAVERRLREQLEPLIEVARLTRVRSKQGPGRGPIQRVARELQSSVSAAAPVAPALGEALEVRSAEARSIVDRYKHTTPDIRGQVNGVDLHAYLTDEETPGAMYAAVDLASNGVVTLRVVANMRHPFLTNVSSSEALSIYLRTVLVFLLAEDDADPEASANRIARQDSLMRTLSGQ